MIKRWGGWVTGLTLVLWAPGAAALPIYAAREGVSCVSCHVDPSGGGMRNAFGFDYMRARHAMTPDPRWEEIPDVQPEPAPGLTVGGDLRMIYTALNRREVEGFPDWVATFIRMQSALYMTYSPLARLDLLVNVDLDQQGFGGPEWFALVRDLLPGGGYGRAGAFRIPYGLRMDDHTIQVRRDLAGGVLGPEGFTLLGEGGDPRSPDVGVETGWIGRRTFLQASVTNGSGTQRDGRDRNLAFTARAGGRVGPLLAGVTTHLDTDGGDGSPAIERRRYGLYGAVPFRDRWVLLGEVDLAEDREAGALNRSLLAWGEVDYFVRRAARLRFRYDFLDVDRGTIGRAAERYTFEVDLTPMPFFLWRLSYRYTQSEFTADLDELVSLLHFHY